MLDLLLLIFVKLPNTFNTLGILVGRFDRLLYVGPPDRKDREDVFRVHLCKRPCNSDVCIKDLALLTEGYTGADISRVCNEASIRAIEVICISTHHGCILIVFLDFLRNNDQS